ncbi:hypothetical protein [Dictyobacter arantiisoli]|uniref:Uncharacterized protein n=1 Tax=Dictyobacter arantiisoli TaxID=2014874 RepID=A0A5A5TG76_9CHLR|nr:hypothetical protein [Dictyobacter arantiisoli]GCF09914.1 hypothetical protein KDI_34780 [Dictyobacter arantiisoli]
MQFSIQHEVKLQACGEMPVEGYVSKKEQGIFFHTFGGYPLLLRCSLVLLVEPGSAVIINPAAPNGV